MKGGNNNIDRAVPKRKCRNIRKIVCFSRSVIHSIISLFSIKHIRGGAIPQLPLRNRERTGNCVLGDCLDDIIENKGSRCNSAVFEELFVCSDVIHMKFSRKSWQTKRINLTISIIEENNEGRLIA